MRKAWTTSKIIDAHAHLARIVEEESNSWIDLGRRARDRWDTPERAVSYMKRNGISKMTFMILILRQFRALLADKAKLPELPEEKLQKEAERIRQQVAPLIRNERVGLRGGLTFPQVIPFCWHIKRPRRSGGNG